MFVSVRVGVRACVCACMCVLVYIRMSDVDSAVSEVPVRECVALLQEFSIHALCLNHPVQYPLPGSDRGGSRDELPLKTCYYYHQRGGSPPSPALIPISTETGGESGPFVSEMFIYATDLPKDMEKPLLQVMTVEPQHIIHFLSFNLVVSMGKFF